jgi:hypothetical protein
MSLTKLEEISQEQDTVFESEDGKGAKVVIDEPSLELLSGSKIDYSMELIGSQFKVTGIPGATSSCGCGSSFDIQTWGITLQWLLKLHPTIYRLFMTRTESWRMRHTNRAWRTQQVEVSTHQLGLS